MVGWSIPTDAAFFFALAGAVLASGLIGMRIWVVDRLRINAGGTEPRWLRIAKRPVDAAIVLIILGAAVMCVVGFTQLTGDAG